MATELDRLVVRLIGDATQYRKTLDDSIRDAQRFAGDIERQVGAAQAQTRHLAGEAEQLAAGVASRFGLAKLSAVGFGVAGAAAFGKIVSEGLRLNAELEKTQIAFETMLGGGPELAKQTIADLRQFAASTPFEMPGITQAARGLIMFGERGGEMLHTLRTLGDAAAGTGSDFAELALIYNQIRGVGNLLTQDFRQLSTRGVISLQDIATHFGVTTAAAQKMMSAGAIAFEDVRAILDKLNDEGGRFANLMEKQSKSLSGLQSTQRDLVAQAKQIIATPFTKIAKEWHTGNILLLESFVGLFTEQTNAKTATDNFTDSQKKLATAQKEVNTFSQEQMTTFGKLAEQWASQSKVIGISEREIKLHQAGLAAWRGEIDFATVDAMENANALLVKAEADEEARKTVKALEKDTASMVKTMQNQIGAMMGVNALVRQRNELAQRGADTTEIDKLIRQHDVLKQVEQLEKQLAKSKRESNQLLEEGRRVAEQFLTPIEKQKKAVEDLNRLFEAGAINEKALLRGLLATEKELLDVEQQRNAAKFLGLEAIRRGSREEAELLARAERLNQESSKQSEIEQQVEKAKQDRQQAMTAIALATSLGPGLMAGLSGKIVPEKGEQKIEVAEAPGLEAVLAMRDEQKELAKLLKDIRDDGRKANRKHPKAVVLQDANLEE